MSKKKVTPITPPSVASSQTDARQYRVENSSFTLDCTMNEHTRAAVVALAAAVQANAEAISKIASALGPAVLNSPMVQVGT